MSELSQAKDSRRITFSYLNGEMLEFPAGEGMTEWLAETSRMDRWFFVDTGDGCALVRTTGLMYVQIHTRPEGAN